MSTFSINKYLNKEEAEAIKEGKKKEEAEPEKQIQIVPIGEKKGSEIVAEALIIALRQDTERFTETPTTDNDIYRKVKIITKQDLSGSFGEAVEFAKGADVLLLETNGEMLGQEESDFLEYVDLPDEQVFFSHNDVIDKFKAEAVLPEPAPEIEEVFSSDIIPGTIVGVTDSGDEETHEGERYIFESTTVFKGETVAILRCTRRSHHFVVVDCSSVFATGD